MLCNAKAVIPTTLAVTLSGSAILQSFEKKERRDVGVHKTRVGFNSGHEISRGSPTRGTIAARSGVTVCLDQSGA